MYAAGAEALEDAISDLGTGFHRLSESEQQISIMISQPSPDQVYWVELRPSGNGLSLNAAPLRVGPLIEKVLWHEKASVILTSATLTTHGEFNYIRDTLGADEADEMQLGSPFDFENSTLLYVANDIPEPNSSDYQHALHRGIISAATAARGRTLVLFTSYAALRKAAQAIAAPLAREDILVYEHGEGASPNVLLESFKSTERAVLLGTRSFWEGVTIPARHFRPAHPQTSIRCPYRSINRRAFRNVRESLWRVFRSGGHPQVPTGIWAPDPVGLGPWSRGHTGSASSYQAVRQALPGVPAQMYTPSGANCEPRPRSQQVARKLITAP
jgi:hypothetical protein